MSALPSSSDSSPACGSAGRRTIPAVGGPETEPVVVDEKHERGVSRLVHTLTELEAEGWYVWIEVTETGNVLAMIRSPMVDILLP